MERFFTNAQIHELDLSPLLANYLKTDRAKNEESIIISPNPSDTNQLLNINYGSYNFDII